MKFNFWTSRSEQKPPRCVILGADSSGKTTLLYLWHTGQVVTTMPTIGFNIENVHHAGRTVQMVDYGASFVRFYLDSSTGILFLHALDSDPERVEQSMTMLEKHVEQLVEAGGKFVWVMVTKQDLVPDEELATKKRELRERLRVLSKGFELQVECKILDEGGLNNLELARTWPVFDLVAKTLCAGDSKPQAVSDRQVYNEEQTRDKIRHDGIDDEPVERFWEQFLAADLPQWNHRNHLRAGYLVLLKSASVLEDSWTATNTFLNHIARLRQAKPDRFRNTAHRTLTRFWLYMLQLCIVSFRNSNGRLPFENEFQLLLLQHPRLYDTSYWADYYNKATIFTPEAKKDWCLPDKKALPVNLDQRMGEEVAVGEAWQDYNSSNNLIRMSEKGSGAQMHLVRFAVSIVQHYFSSSERRGQVIASGLARLQKSTLQLRAPGNYTATTIPPYSETQAYFWIQIVHATLAPFQQRHQGSTVSATVDARNKAVNSISTLTYAQFMHIFPIDPTLWKRYYTADLWNSIQARVAFVNPDLRPLPSVFPQPPPSVVAQRFVEINNALSASETRFDHGYVDEKADANTSTGRSSDETMMRIDSILAAVIRSGLISDPADIRPREHSTDERGQSADTTALNSLATVLFKLYQALNASTNPKTLQIDVSDFVGSVLCNKMQQPSSQNRITNSIEDHVDTDLKSSLDNVGLSDEQTDNPQAMGMTKLMFYARMTLALSNTVLEPEAKSPPCSIDGFKDFLVSRSALVWEDLPFGYYKSETWNSLDARMIIVSPDLKALP